MVGDAVLRSLRHVWLEIERLGAVAAVAGGLALSMWRYVRATRDVDLLIGIDERELEHVLSELRGGGLRPKKDPPAISLGSMTVVPLVYEPPEAYLDVQIDLLLAGSEYQQQALRRRVETQLPGIEFPLAVLTCEDLILHKLLAGRLIDRVDARELLRINVDMLDEQYLADWVERLQLVDEFTEAWTSALPGTPPPGEGSGS